MNKIYKSANTNHVNAMVVYCATGEGDTNLYLDPDLEVKADLRDVWNAYVEGDVFVNMGTSLAHVIFAAGDLEYGEFTFTIVQGKHFRELGDVKS